MKRVIPDNIQRVLTELVSALRECLGDNLVGIYLHGSLAMGTYNPTSSDIDILVVVKNNLTVDEKKDIGSRMIDLSKKLPAHGFEMSIVTLDVVRDFKYPTPYELHFSDSNKQEFINGTVNLMEPKTDSDLAAHFVIVRKRGVCLFGEPISNIFSDIPQEYYLDSIIKDAQWSYQHVLKGPNSGTCEVPVYAVLNFCRVLGFIREGLILSKTEGGQWGLKNLPDEYAPIIREALREYEKSGTGVLIDCSLLKQFAEYAMKCISDTASLLSPEIVNDVDQAIFVMKDAGRWLVETGKNPSKWWQLQNLTQEFLFRYARKEEFFVALVDGRPAAAAVLRISAKEQDWELVDKDNPQPAVYIHWFCVHRAFAGKGLPKVMIDFAATLAHEHHIALLRVDTNAEKAKPRALYENLGFRLVATKEEEYRKSALYQKNI